MNLALDLTRELLKSDGTTMGTATRVEIETAMRHTEAALLFIAKNMDRYIKESARLAAARDAA